MCSVQCGNNYKNNANIKATNDTCNNSKIYSAHTHTNTHTSVLPIKCCIKRKICNRIKCSSTTSQLLVVATVVACRNYVCIHVCVCVCLHASPSRCGKHYWLGQFTWLGLRTLVGSFNERRRRRLADCRAAISQTSCFVSRRSPCVCVCCCCLCDLLALSIGRIGVFRLWSHLRAKSATFQFIT